VQEGQRPVSIAGDCVSSLGMLAGLQQAGRQPGRILWLDAHGDFHTWGTTQTQYLGGMPLAMLVGRKDRRQNARDAIQALRSSVGCTPFPEQQVLLSDARDLDPGEDEALRSSRICRCGIGQILPLLSRQESLYVHFDTDVLDAEQQMPALKYHVKAGPDIDQMRELFRQLRRFPLVAVSVSAWHAERDEGDRAARVTLELLDELLA
jgi:arginase